MNMTSGGGVIPKEGCSYIQIKPTLADFDQNLRWVQISCVKQINIPPPRKILTESPLPPSITITTAIHPSPSPSPSPSPLTGHV